MHGHDTLLRRRSALGRASGIKLICSPTSGAAAQGASTWRSSLGPSAPAALLGSTTPQCPLRPSLRRQPASRHAPQPAAAAPRQRQQPPATQQGPMSSREVQGLLKRLVRANMAMTVVEELNEWRETAPGSQQQGPATVVVVGTAALQVLTRVLGPGAKLHPHQWQAVQALVRSLVVELHDLREALTLEQLSAVASSLVVLLPLLGAHSGEAAAGMQGVPAMAADGQDGQEAQAEQISCTCSPQQARKLAAALPQLVEGIMSRQELPAVLVPVCQAYGSVLQLVQLTHTDPQGRLPGALTQQVAEEVEALHASLSRTVLCAPRLSRQLGHVAMADLGAAVQVAVQYRFAVSSGTLPVPPSFWEAVRKRVDELLWTAREGTVVVVGAPAAGTGPAAAAGPASWAPDTALDVQPLVAILEAMSRDLAVKQREAERDAGGADKKPKGPGGAEAWLVDTVTLLLRSHQAGMQDKRCVLMAAVESAERQLLEAKGDLEAADSKRRALQARLQQLQKQAGKKKKAKAGQQAEAQQQGEGEEAKVALAKANEEYDFYEEMVQEAGLEVEARRRELRELGVVCVRQQLDVAALLQLTTEAAEAAVGVAAAAGGGGTDMGAALEGLIARRLRELQPAQLVQALSVLSKIRHSASPATVSSMLGALVPHLGELSHVQQLDMLRALSGPGEQLPESTAGFFLSALTRAVASNRPGGLGAAPAELLLALMGAAARWRVPLGQEWVREVEEALARRLSSEGEGEAAGGAANCAGASTGAEPGADVEQGAPAALHSARALRRQLMSDVVLPAVRQGRLFSKPDLFVLGLEEWRGRATKPFPGLDAATAALLLGWAARRHGWPPTASLHRVVEALAGAALRLRLETSDEVAKMLLVASRAVDACTPAEQEQGGGPAAVPHFRMSAASQLLSMKPTTNDLASAIAALCGKPRPGPDLALLKRMLDMAQPQLAGARPLSFAQLLTGCVAAGWRPDDRWLAEHHAAAAKALRAHGAADADALLQLLSALSEPTLAAQAGSNSAYLAAREALLLEVAQGLVRKPALTSLAAQPDALVYAVRQVVVQGVRPDGPWIVQVVELTQELLPSLSPTGLASATETLAQLRAAPPVSFLDDLLTLAGEYDTESYGAGQLGLLLGGVQALRRMQPSGEDGDGSSLSPEAATAWGRMHAAFLPHCLDVLPTYKPAQAVMVAGGVVAFQLAQPVEGTSGVDAPWLSRLLVALLQRRTPAAPPPPALLLDLLCLASRVLPRGDTLEPSSSPQEGQEWSLLRDYVQRSLSDLAAAGTEDVPWPQLLRAALAVGVRPEPGVLQRYAASLAQTLYDTVKSKAPSKQQLSGGVGTLEEAITSALMPALPWAPEGNGGSLLGSVLGDQKLLRACSPGQLALLCTYATQSGLGAKAAFLWRNMAAEVQARGAAFLPVAPGESTAVAAAAADALAVWYALEVAGCGVTASGQRGNTSTWLGQKLQEMDGAGGSGGGGVGGVAVAPQLQALHALWVAHRLDGLALVPQGVWATLHAASTSEEQLRQLLPYQLAQLVELRAAAAAAGLQLPPAPGGYAVRVLDTLGQHAEAAQEAAAARGARGAMSAAGEARLLRGLACARALAFLPADELRGSWASLVPLSLSFFVESTTDTDTTAFGSRATGLNAVDAAAWISSVEGTLGGSALTLTLQQLQGVVKALVVPAVAHTAGTKGSRDAVGASDVGLGLGEVERALRQLQLLAISPPGSKALAILAPLLQRLAAAGDGSLLTVSSVAQLTALASAIIQAGGNQALPRRAAAALVRLLSCEGVLQQLPSGEVAQLVQYSLDGRFRLGDEGRLPDAVADALVMKLVDEEDVSPLHTSVAVLRCGAGPDIVGRVAAFMLQDVEFAPSRRSILQLVNDLALLYNIPLEENAAVSGVLSATLQPLIGGAGPVGTPLADYTLEAVKGLAAAARRGSTELWQEQYGKPALLVVHAVEVLYRRFHGLHIRRGELLESMCVLMDSMPVPGGGGAGGDRQLPGYGAEAGGLWAALRCGPEAEEGSPIWAILQAAVTLGCPELGAHRHMGSGKVSAQASAAAAATEPSYWQLLAAQYGSTGSHWRASSPHGPFLMSPSKAYQLAMHLARCTLLYYSCVEAVAEPSSPLAASLRSKGVPVEDIERHGLYGSKGLCARRLALLISLLLDCEARRHELGLDEAAARELKATVYELQDLWALKLYKAGMECVTEFWEAPASADRTASAKVLDVALDAFELIVMCTPRDHDGYRLLLERFRLAALDLHFGLVGIMTSTHPPLPEGVTHWDDLALLVSPDRLDEAALLEDLCRPPAARRFPLVLPTHLRTPAGGSPTPAQEAYIKSITPVFVTLRKLLALAAADGGLMRMAKCSTVKTLNTHQLLRQAVGMKTVGMAPPLARWAVLLGLVTLPEDVCQWLAQKDVSRAKVGSRGVERAVQERAAELLARVPWAGHTWAPLQEALGDEERERLEREMQEERAGQELAAGYRDVASAVWHEWLKQDRELRSYLRREWVAGWGGG